jgi:predicted O-linked N-acetylglucosamine transferase (SPINDLY family)
MAEHLARYRLADLFIDTFPYNAHTTACDSLWAGVPVLTCAGNSFASRVAASLLSAIGLPELVTHTHEAYEALALELATNPAKLAAIRQKLADHRITSPLFDTTRLAHDMEQVFATMVQRHQDGLAPEHIGH